MTTDKEMYNSLLEICTRGQDAYAVQDWDTYSACGAECIEKLDALLIRDVESRASQDTLLIIARMFQNAATVKAKGHAYKLNLPYEKPTIYDFLNLCMELLTIHHTTSTLPPEEARKTILKEKPHLLDISEKAFLVASCPQDLMQALECRYRILITISEAENHDQG